MQTKEILKVLIDQGIILPTQAQHIQKLESDKPFSVYKELRSLLYVGILLSLSGISLLIYQYLDQIGHSIILTALTFCMVGCFYFAFYKKNANRNLPTTTAQTIEDYILLLGCSLFLIIEGYLQFQYQIFGNRYGLATLLPTLLFFTSAYYFDHKGVLTMAIMGLASWLGLTIAPGKILNNDFNDPSIAFTGSCFGILLIAFGLLSERWKLKPHFVFTYLLTGSFVALTCITIAIFEEHFPYGYILSSFLLCLFLALLAFHRGDFIFILMGTLSAYIVVSYLVLEGVFKQPSTTIYLIYFIISSVAVLLFLIKISNVFKKSKSNL
jgi:hypothetical protein